MPITEEDLEKAKNEGLRKEIPVYLLSPKKLDYSLKRDAYSFRNWEDEYSLGYCCGMSISNAELYEGVYRADKSTYELKKEDKIKVPVRGWLTEKKLEDVIRRDQLFTCFSKFLLVAFQRLQIKLGLKSIEDVNKEAFQELTKLIDEGKPAFVVLNYISKAPGHAVVGVGYASSGDYKVIFVYDSNYIFPPYTSFQDFNLWMIAISPEWKILNSDFEFLIVTSFTKFEINVTEEIINTLKNLTEQFSKQLLEENLSLILIYGNFSFQTDADYFYPIPGSKNVVLFFMEPKNEIKVNTSGAEVYLAKPTNEMKANITIIKLENGNFLITSTKVGRVQRYEIYIILIIAVIILFITVIFIFKRILKKISVSSASYLGKKEKRQAQG
ncbi:MAG: hypothetical protein QW738_07555 [Nitrososphaeria archaeon]